MKECLDSGWVSSAGAFVDRFEREICRYVGSSFAVATVNGTAALHVALMVAGVRRDDEVLVSTLTFIAPVNAIRYVGAWPVFIDADPKYWQMDSRGVIEFLERRCRLTHGVLRNRVTGRRVAAILPVHALGHPVDMAPILDVAKRFGLLVIEDATEALGSRYRGRAPGTLGDIGCFSFNGNKILTTGGGGMIVTDSRAWADRARYLTTQAKDDPVEYIHGTVGFNYRLTNLQAAVGCAQLERLEGYVAAKRRIARRYAHAFAGVAGLKLMPEATWARSNWWLSTVLVDTVRFGLSSRELLRHLEGQCIQTRPLWQPAHKSQAHADATPARCPNAERLNRDALSLPSSVGLTASDQKRVIEEVLRLSRASRSKRSRMTRLRKPHRTIGGTGR